MTQYGPAIVDLLELFRFQVTDVGEISEVEEATQNFTVPITVGWCYAEQWKLAPDELALSGVSLKINLREL